jgi:tRNA threonylcarbamoyladenosine biosynthesis protein TsaB
VTRIVAIDTTSEFGSLALVEDGRVVEEILLHSAEGFAHILFPHMLRLMERHAWRAGEVTGYAAAAGPGSFTGVRVGLTAAKGLAETAGLKAAAVSNLEAMATYGSSKLRAPFFDARRGEIYGALYNSKLRALRPEMAQALPEWLASLPPEAELLTPDAAPFAAALGERPVTQTPRALAGAIGRLAAMRLVDPIQVDANYVRRSDAELHWKDGR